MWTWSHLNSGLHPQPQWSLVVIILLYAEVTLELNIGDIHVAQLLGELDGGPQKGVDQ